MEDSASVNGEEWLLQNLPTVAPYLNLESLWQMRSLSKRFKEALQGNGELWWALVKQEADDPALNPCEQPVDWVTVALALKLGSKRRESAFSHRGFKELMSAAHKLREIHKIDVAIELYAHALKSAIEAAAKGEEKEKKAEEKDGGKDRKEKDKEKTAVTRDVADATYHLSIARGMIGDISGENGAEAMRRKSVEMYTVLCGECSEEVAAAHFALGDALLVQTGGSKLDEAQSCYEKALALRIAIHGEESEQVAQSISGLAIAAAQRGDDKHAIEYLNRALEIRSKVFGNGSQQCARTFANLGAVYAKTDTAKARDMFEKAYRLRNATLGPRHPLTCRSKRLFEKYEAEAK